MSNGIDWNIMVYIAADGSLANFAVESLEQLKNNIGSYSNLVVAAQWDLDGQRKSVPSLPGSGPIRRRIFEGNGCATTRLDAGAARVAGNMADAETLKEFIKWVYREPKCRDAARHCLILWGHGPELFYEAAVSPKQKSVYLTPAELRKALEDAFMEIEPQSGNTPRLDIIGLDACSMSSIEFAGELQGCAPYMVASQEEVPDMSFPYNLVLKLFSKGPTDIAQCCRDGLDAYMQAYEDYDFAAYTGMKPVTISALYLEKLGDITNAIQGLAKALQHASKDQGARGVIFESREASKGFVGGLFVDLYDFCDQLKKKIQKIAVEPREKLAKACDSIIAAFDPKPQNEWLVGRKGLDCHGLSIYFPYLTDSDKNNIDEATVPLVKGGIDTLNKGGIDTLNKAGADVLMDVRKQMIQDIEKQYPDLKVAQTGWYEFIEKGWSRILAENGPNDLDMRYSAEQCFWNLLDERCASC